MSLFPGNHKSGLFVHAAIDVVAGFLIKWGNEINRYTRRERKSMSLEEAWPFVDESRIFSPNRAFLIPISNGWTAFFDNQSREFLAGSELVMLCQNLKVDTCFFSYDHSDATEHCGSIHFCYNHFIGGEFPVKERSLMLLKESGWQFKQYGDPLPFEDLTAYQRPKKKERLTPDILRQYGQAIGIPFWDPAAYRNSVYQLRWGDGPVPDTETTLKKNNRGSRYAQSYFSRQTNMKSVA